MFKPNNAVLERFAGAFFQDISLKKTHLHLASELSWSSFEKYLDWLQDNNYIETKYYRERIKYQLTESGREMFGKLTNFLDSVRVHTPTKSF